MVIMELRWHQRLVSLLVSPLLLGFVDVVCPASKDAWRSVVTAGLVTVFGYRRAEL